jgi:hypothetical protein
MYDETDKRRQIREQDAKKARQSEEATRNTFAYFDSLARYTASEKTDMVKSFRERLKAAGVRL